MARNDHERPVQLGIFDRLIDEQPGTRTEAPLTRERSIALLRSAVKRDLEWLLNTIRIADNPPEAYSELADSLWMYGFPDVNSMSLQSTQDEQKLLNGLERAIERFEPRLKRVRITSYERVTKSRPTIDFHVDAMLMIDPLPERIAFDTVLEVAKGSYRVKE